MQQIINADSLEYLKTLEDNSIDAIVTDPPYGLSFMGKKWDYDVPSVEMWAECLRVLKPGGYLLAFAGTRTQHRMAVRIEDAGFEIRDMIAWIYGSGFPKSLNIGKAINKIDGVEFKSKPAGGVGFMNNDKEDGYNTTINQLEQVGESSERAKQWEGWGTALKPALEPITVARKPLSENTVAENCLKWGVGGINIDGCRVGTTGARNNGNSKGTEGSNSIGVYGKAIKQDYNMGRFPANLIHDGSEEVLELFPYTKSGVLKSTQYETPSGNNDSMFAGDGKYSNKGYEADSGSAGRFFQKCEMACGDISFMVDLDICGNILENQKAGIMLYGVIKEVEKLTQNVEQFMCGNKTLENIKQATTSIISTLIKLTTELKISDVSLLKNITTFMVEKEKTIQLLEELNTEDARSAENIKLLITFKNEVSELIKDIVKIAVVQNLKNGENSIEKNTTNITDNTANRIIYTAKASKKERGVGNNHPTVKSLKLMEYLVKLVSKEGHTVLDPFLGSGTTAIACKNLNRNCIGIERDAEYVKIAEARIKGM